MDMQSQCFRFNRIRKQLVWARDFPKRKWVDCGSYYPPSFRVRRLGKRKWPGCFGRQHVLAPFSMSMRRTLTMVSLSRYLSTKKLLMKHMEDEEKILFAQARAAMDLSMGQIEALLMIHQRLLEAMWFPNTADRYLLTGKGCQAQVKHTHFEYEQDRILRYFPLGIGPKVTMIWACHSLHWPSNYSMREKKMMDKALKMKEVAVLVLPVFVGSGYEQHAEPLPRYHKYRIPEWCNLKDAVGCLYGCSLRHQKRLASDSSAGDVNSAGK